jgi:Cu(I)/Ag(I) efflux system membrane fusion protein
VPQEKNASTAKPMRERMLYAFRFVSQPLLFFAAGLALLALLGVAQRAGWISAGGSSTGGSSPASAVADVDYICPMMCTPPQKEPGRCPVCAMELVPASGGSAGGDERSVVVDPATRRVANIKTVSVRRVPLTKTIRAVGELAYDEGKLKTISAYTNGRFDQLYVDYTGAVVCEGDRLASFYSPELYSSQVEYLEATQALANSRGSSTSSISKTNRRMQSSSRQRLVEFGMSEAQIEQLAREGKARSRLDIVAPMHGTVIEKLAVEGEYVKEGEPIFRLADLTTVWLMLELFPEDASAVRYGQAVEATIKSLPDRTLTGRIAFIDPEVNKLSRTVSVRVVLDNADGFIRIGDYAKASISIRLGLERDQLVYDPELANKWISPRHPHIVSDEPGLCSLCGIELKPAAELGFTDRPTAERTAVVVPRNAVLNAANESVVYVETETGRFEIRRVVTGASSGDDIVIVKGLAEGEQVATSGNFLLDSQMQLAGNPSLIDPARAAPPLEMVAGFNAKELAEIDQLPNSEQTIALAQVICPVTDFKLGSMGVPRRVMVNGEPVFICCEACREGLLEEPDMYLAKLQDYRANGRTAAGASSETFEVPEIGEMVPIDDEAVPEIGAIEMIESDDAEIPEVQMTFDGLEGGNDQ